MVRFKKRRAHKKNKFCPVCGAILEITDTYCTNCGYSFQQRHRKRGIKWKNLIIFAIIILLIYIGFRYLNNQQFIPDFLKNILNFSIGNKTN
ncbi:MAG: DUF2116 family Zn-ribbon domain-containing protein [Nanoarchaeota archaeon]|nr:DUF2116 family Zn-ribbon domain-containing protein [Nanoarchaeota archaeon]